MATYLIGDVQGCYDALSRLLEAIDFDPATDRLWPCGDLVNRGGQSLETLRLFYSLRDAVSPVMGNHDLHLLAADHQHPEGKSRNREFARILQAPDREALIGWVNALPLAAWSAEHGILRVHAGVIPQWDYEQTCARAQEVSAKLQSAERAKYLDRMYGNTPNKWRDNRKGWSRLRLITNILTRIRFCDADGRCLFKLTGAPGSQPAPYRPWFKHKHRKTRSVVVAFGHWAAMGLRIKKRYLAMDSGAVWGGHLSALRIEDRQLFQVKGLTKR